MSILKEKFANRLRMIRLEKGLSQENMAELTEMSQGGYAKIERGETEVTLERVEQIAKILQVDVANLLEINNVVNYTNSGSGQFAANNQGPTTFNFDKLMMDGLLSKMEKQGKEIEELKRKMGL